jgi:hypothetical protein
MTPLHSNLYGQDDYVLFHIERTWDCTIDQLAIVFEFIVRILNAFYSIHSTSIEEKEVVD